MNNTKIHFLLISACALVVLAACETVPAPTTDRQNGVPPTEVTSDIQKEIPNSLATDALRPEVGTQQTEAMADGLSEQDQRVMAEALEKQQESLCEQMSSPELRDGCHQRIVSALQQSAQTAQLQTDEDKMAELRNSVQQSNDPQRCRELQDANQVAGCELNILVNNAVATGDLSVCAQASSESTQADCRRDAQELLQMVVPLN